MGDSLQAEEEIKEKSNTAAISDSVNGDEVGTLPDFGLGEAFDRVPSVATIQNNDRRKFWFLSLRGLNADYDLVEIDGVAFPANEFGRRNVSLDAIPSSLSSRIDIQELMTAAGNANAIGGITNGQVFP
ncbi:MAG: hypothetical protein EP321_01100 [Sphingomonadales bacterium]|nr:MAG: hypothetical protein EP345_16615 [Sphingomonadales bacterium]TNF06186.1 MAG: hypothetical protein EP321_01100 [Sphingomonadales bacterium]